MVACIRCENRPALRCAYSVVMLSSATPRISIAELFNAVANQSISIAALRLSLLCLCVSALC